jgi:hypothetical protein
LQASVVAQVVDVDEATPRNARNDRLSAQRHAMPRCEFSPSRWRWNTGYSRGKTIAVDATTLEANAAMKSLVRRDTGEDWREYVRRLAAAEGMENPSDEELRRFDRKREKKTSNHDWQSATDPDSRVTKMKDGRTHLACKAEHALDVDSEPLVAAVVYRGK